MSDPIDIKDQCLQIIVDKVFPGRPYPFKWLDHELYLFLKEESSEGKKVLNIYVVEE